MWRAVLAPAVFDTSCVAGMVAVGVALMRVPGDGTLLASTILTMVGLTAVTLAWRRRSGVFLYPATVLLAGALALAMWRLDVEARSGYAFGALLVRDGYTVTLSLGSLVFTELLRGILAPVGHRLWTGILGGVLFGEARNGHLRFTPSVIATYIGVSLLHGLWDSMRGIAMVLTELLTLAQAQRIGMGGAVLLPPTEQQVQLFTTIEMAGLAIISLIGLALLWRVWSKGCGPAVDVDRAYAGAHLTTCPT
jgi:hypothetical protein